MSDTISRRAVINAHKEYCKKHPNAQWYKWSLSIMQTSPSVEPKRNVGRWVEADGSVIDPDASRGEAFCDQCGESALDPPFWECWQKLSKYCPSCGAKMKNAEEAKP